MRRWARGPITIPHKPEKIPGVPGFVFVDRDNEAINRCYLLGYIPEAVTAKARKKLMAKCQKAVTAHAQVNTPVRNAGEKISNHET